MGKEKNKSGLSPVLKSLLSCFYGFGESKYEEASKDATRLGTEATMINAAQHFISAHKVRLAY